jgi:hypothetical protein
MLVLTVALTVTFNIGLRTGIERSDGSARCSLQDSLLHVFGSICQQGLYVTSLKYLHYTGRSKLLTGRVTVTLFLEAVTPCVSGATEE